MFESRSADPARPVVPLPKVPGAASLQQQHLLARTVAGRGGCSDVMHLCDHASPALPARRSPPRSMNASGGASIAWGDAGSGAASVSDKVSKLMKHAPGLRGERNPSAKLGSAQVRQIREGYVPQRVSMKRLADEYGVNAATVFYVIHGTTWNQTAGTAAT